MESLNHQNNKDMALQAKLHGFKMKAPMKVQKWTKETDQKMKDFAQKRYEKMQAEARMKNEGGN